MSVTPFPLVDMRGAPFDRGVQYGQQAAERIARTLAIYLPAFESAGFGLSEVRELANDFLERIGRYDQDQLAELYGIARGCGRPVADLVAINARTELLYGVQPGLVEHAPLDDGCTAAAATPAATATSHLVHAQNWDWRDDCYEAVVVLRIEMPDGLRILSMAEAGMLARCGFNSAGVGLTGNFLRCELDDGREGVPVPCVRRRVLNSRSLRDGLSEILRAPRSFSNNVMISHAQGEVIDLETTPGPVFWMHATDGILVHANHFMTNAAFARVQDLGLTVAPDSLYRERRVSELLRARGRKLTLDDFRDALSDRFGAPFAVCREVTVGPGGERVSTVATVIMDITAGQMWIAPVPYRSREFFCYSLASNEIVRAETLG